MLGDKAIPRDFRVIGEVMLGLEISEMLVSEGLEVVARAIERGR